MTNRSINPMLDSSIHENVEMAQPVPAPKNKNVAMLLSLCLLGGAGHLYLGQKKKGWLLIIISAVTSCVGLDFIVLVFAAIDAYYMSDKLEKGQTIGEMEWFLQKTTVIMSPVGDDQAAGDDNPGTVTTDDDQAVGSNRVII